MALIPPLPSAMRLSMDVYAQALKRQFLREELGIRPVDLDLPTSLLQGPGTSRHWSNARAWSKSYFGYPDALARVDAHLYHITDHSEAHLMRRLDPRRTIVTCHDLTPFEIPEHIFPRWPGRLVGGGLFRYSVSFLKRAAAVIADSEATMGSLIKFAGVSHSRIWVVALGADAPAPDGLHPSVTGAALSVLPGTYVIHVGTCGPQKNLETVLRVLRAARRSVPALGLVQVGGSLTDGQWKLAEQLGVSTHVYELGIVPSDVLNAVVRRALALVYPSLWEGFGLPVLEAMYAGVPVIVSDAGSLPEVVWPSRLIFNPFDYEGIAEAVSRLHHDNSFRRTALATADQAKARYSWARTARNTAAVYKHVALAIGSPARLEHRSW